MRKAYLEWDTLWIINARQRIAYETRQYDSHPMPNEVFIAHDMSDRHSTAYLEMQSTCKEVTVPERFIAL